MNAVHDNTMNIAHLSSVHLHSLLGKSDAKAQSYNKMEVSSYVIWNTVNSLCMSSQMSWTTDVHNQN